MVIYERSYDPDDGPRPFHELQCFVCDSGGSRTHIILLKRQVHQPFCHRAVVLPVGLEPTFPTLKEWCLRYPTRPQERSIFLADSRDEEPTATAFVYSVSVSYCKNIAFIFYLAIPGAFGSE